MNLGTDEAYHTIETPLTAEETYQEIKHMVENAVAQGTGNGPLGYGADPEAEFPPLEKSLDQDERITSFSADLRGKNGKVGYIEGDNPHGTHNNEVMVSAQDDTLISDLEHEIEEMYDLLQ